MVNTTAPAAKTRPSVSRTPATSTVREQQVVRLALDHGKIGRLPKRFLHGRRVKFPVGLGARPADGRPFAAIEHAKLNAGRIRHPAHQAIERVDLAHQMALAESADGWIARHGADGREPMSYQRRSRAHARSSGRGFTAGMATADDDDIETCVHCISPQRRLI